jgi:hypothetical protein
LLEAHQKNYNLPKSSLALRNLQITQTLAVVKEKMIMSSRRMVGMNASGREVGGKIESDCSSRNMINKSVIHLITDSNFYGHASRVAMIPPENRKQLDVDILLKATGFLTFFKNMNKKKSYVEFNCHQRCCKWLHTQWYPKGKAAIEYNAIPDNFYIILRGAVGIYLPCPLAKRLMEKKAVDLLTKLTKNKTGKDRTDYAKIATKANGFTDEMIEAAGTYQSITKEGFVTYKEEVVAKIVGKDLEFKYLNKTKLVFDEDTGIQNAFWLMT